MNTHPEPIGPNHPAVEAANKATKRAYGSRGADAAKYHATALAAALPHLTADDLRSTPAGQALMAEAWEEGAMDRVRRVYIGRMSQKTLSIVRERIAGANPYLEGDGAAS